MIELIVWVICVCYIVYQTLLLVGWMKIAQDIPVTTHEIVKFSIENLTIS